MKRALIAACACLLVGTTSSFAQDRSTEDTQTPNAAPSPPATGNQGDMGTGTRLGNNTQNKNAMQSGHEGEQGAQMTRKQCQDLGAQESQNPNMQRDPAKDKACAKILSRSGNSNNATQTQ